MAQLFSCLRRVSSADRPCRGSSRTWMFSPNCEGDTPHTTPHHTTQQGRQREGGQNKHTGSNSNSQEWQQQCV